MNRAKKRMELKSWNKYRRSLNTFKTECRRLKKELWIKFCKELENTSETILQESKTNTYQTVLMKYFKCWMLAFKTTLRSNNFRVNGTKIFSRVQLYFRNTLYIYLNLRVQSCIWLLLELLPKDVWC